MAVSSDYLAAGDNKTVSDLYTVDPAGVSGQNKPFCQTALGGIGAGMEFSAGADLLMVTFSNHEKGRTCNIYHCLHFPHGVLK